MRKQERERQRKFDRFLNFWARICIIVVFVSVVVVVAAAVVAILLLLLLLWLWSLLVVIVVAVVLNAVFSLTGVTYDRKMSLSH